MVTREEIARKAGVSRTTVYRALTGNPHLKKEKRDLILSLVEKYNYTHHYLARALKTGKTKTCSTIFANTRGSFMGKIIEGIEEEFLFHGYHTFISTSQDSPQREKEHLELVLKKHVEGILFFPFPRKKGKEKDLSFFTQILKKRVKIVFVDTFPEELEDKIEYVVTEDRRGGYMASSYLLELGHRKIGVISKNEDTFSLNSRLRGIKEALLQRKINLEFLTLKLAQKDTEKEGERLTLELLNQKEPPTAIICLTDPLSLGALRALKSQNLKVPQDISLLTYGGVRETRLVEPPLSAIKQPLELLGKEAARLLVRRMKGDKRGFPQHIKLKPRLLKGGSCAPPKNLRR